MFSKIKNPSSWTMFIFGVLAVVLGVVGLISPETILGQLGFEIADRAARPASDYTLVFITASSMASFNVGIYYVLAAQNNMKKFYGWTVPFRGLTFVIFTVAVLRGLAPARFILVAVWELLGAVATGIALAYEKKNDIA